MKVKPARHYLPASPPDTWAGWAKHFARWAGQGLWSLTVTTVRSPFWPWLWRATQQGAYELTRKINDKLR